jgi:hypothetical protein
MTWLDRILDLVAEMLGAPHVADQLAPRTDAIASLSDMTEQDQNHRGDRQHRSDLEHAILCAHFHFRRCRRKCVRGVCRLLYLRQGSHKQRRNTSLWIRRGCIRVSSSHLRAAAVI